MVKLPSHDPISFFLGNVTNCCQLIDGHGKQCVIDGITLENNGFYVLLKVNKSNYKSSPIIDNNINYNDFDIVGQCYAWLSQHGNLVFDSWENLRPECEDTVIEVLLPNFSKKINDENPSILMISIGNSQKTPASFKTGKYQSEQMKEGKQYSDSLSQTILYFDIKNNNKNDFLIKLKNCSAQYQKKILESSIGNNNNEKENNFNSCLELLSATAFFPNNQKIIIDKFQHEISNIQPENIQFLISLLNTCEQHPDNQKYILELNANRFNSLIIDGDQLVQILYACGRHTDYKKMILNLIKPKLNSLIINQSQLKSLLHTGAYLPDHYTNIIHYLNDSLDSLIFLKLILKLEENSDYLIEILKDLSTHENIKRWLDQPGFFSDLYLDLLSPDVLKEICSIHGIDYDTLERQELERQSEREKENSINFFSNSSDGEVPCYSMSNQNQSRNHSSSEDNDSPRGRRYW